MTSFPKPSICHFLWGKFFTDLSDVYCSSPHKPAVSEQGFKGRVRKRNLVMGYVSQDCLLRALLSTRLRYEGGGGIYLIRQKSTGLKYYGRSDCPTERIRSHMKHFHGGACRLQREMQKAGLDDFEFVILFQGDVTREHLCLIERALIWYEDTIWPNGLNSA
ncbi:GIY-YIG nuclease family protein [Aliisedimentitalea sp. MJ-SS2]|uniref:GIY-YIG nuclease family protein n=1 Tax=Aliisedimentitalea sp. MJ-SS2 TaxID=3049795 RepID=UPI00345F32D3